jgi:hypothetical protein
VEFPPKIQREIETERARQSVSILAAVV